MKAIKELRLYTSFDYISDVNVTFSIDKTTCYIGHVMTNIIIYTN